MALDSRLIIASDLQSYIVDKDTGLPLSAGVIKFFKDQARTIPKNVYKLSGSPPNYSYVSLGNEITLSSVGTVQDDDTGDDIILYYFPYEGTPDDSDSTIELYYVTVESALGVNQFTREAWPNLATTEEAEQNLVNYIPNGQFKIHTDIPASPNDTPYEAGEIRDPITYLAQGGWTFERPNGSTAEDFVLFKTFGDYVTNPTASPRYYAQIKNESPNAGDNFKDLRIKFNDVNKFASTTQKYTFAFTGKSNSSGSTSISLVLIKNYGTGGDPEEEIPLGNFTITTSFSIIQVSGFSFGNNEGKTIGSDNDDFIQLAVRFPVNQIFDVSVTDFILTPGDITVTNFPQTPDREFSYQSLTADIPAYDSSDLYLPLVLTKTGLTYDAGLVGAIFPSVRVVPPVGYLNCDGTKYETAAYSSDGIPYSRLQGVLFNNTTNIPNFGTGTDYLTAYVNNVSTNLRIATNTTGATTDAADVNTGFTITTQHTGAQYETVSFPTSSNTIYIVTLVYGVITAPSAGTSGFTVNLVRAGSATLRQLIEVQTLAAAGLAGLYFLYSTFNDAYYVWFRVDGAGADPAIGGRTGIRIDLLSAYDATTVAAMIAEALSGNQITNVVCGAASTLTAGDYFNIYTASTEFYVWYQINGTGTDPAPANKTGIKVNVLSADTAAQVVSKTQNAINSKYFAVPDLRGAFIRGFDATGVNDPDYNTRYSPYGAYLGVLIGQREFDEIMSHNHGITSNIVTATGAEIYTAGLEGEPNTVEVDYYGSFETRPANTSFNYIIKY